VGGSVIRPRQLARELRQLREAAGYTLDAAAVAVRDTKDRTRAPHVYTCQEWAAFLLAVRSGEFDRP
jgi:hypothetical protein